MKPVWKNTLKNNYWKYFKLGVRHNPNNLIYILLGVFVLMSTLNSQSDTVTALYGAILFNLYLLTLYIVSSISIGKLSKYTLNDNCKNIIKVDEN